VYSNLNTHREGRRPTEAMKLLVLVNPQAGNGAGEELGRTLEGREATLASIEDERALHR
jgi:hypothetical protein